MTPAGDLHEPTTWPIALQSAMATYLPESGIVYVALSGGLDSVFLLYVAASWYRHVPGVDVRATHVNHNLNAGAGEMERVCEYHCVKLNVALIRHSVEVPSSHASPEDNARQARYQAFTDLLKTGEHLLMAHHRNDQAETVLFRLLRGSGVRGLAGIPRQRALGPGELMRPLLDISRDEIKAWSQAWGLDWAEDPSNTDCAFDRNFLRHRILPLIATRWPGFRSALASTASHAAESEWLNERLAVLQLRDIQDENGRLNTEALGALSVCEQKNILRFWIRQQQARPPGAAKLAQGIKDLITARHDRVPAVVGENYSIRRFRNHLCFVPAQPEVPDQTVNWQPSESMEWGGGLVRLEGQAGTDVMLRVARRQGGERFRPYAGGHSRSLKKWLQERAVPPWERDRLPLVWHHDELVAIGNLWSSADTDGSGSRPSWRVIWEPTER